MARRVLVVDDSLDCRESMRLVLEIMGYEVEVAADGEEGLAKALAWRPGAGLFDIAMPGMNGYELAAKVREGLGRDVLLIALTGFGPKLNGCQALHSGFDHHLTKPADLDQLCRLLASGPSRASPTAALPRSD